MLSIINDNDVRRIRRQVGDY